MNNYPRGAEVKGKVIANTSRLVLREFYTIEDAKAWARDYNAIYRLAGLSVNIHGCRAKAALPDNF